MFSTHGFGNTRFDEVAKQKGLTTGALYHHFKNKKDLFEQVFIQCAEEVSRQFPFLRGKNHVLDSILPSKALARFISGGTNELALWVSESENIDVAMEESRTVIKQMIKQLQGDQQ